MIYIADILSYSDSNGKNTGHWLYLSKMYCDLIGRDKVTILGGAVYSCQVEGYQFIQLPYNVIEGISSVEKLRRMVLNAKYMFNICKGNTIILQYGNPFSNHISILLGYKPCNLFLIEYSDIGIKGLGRSFVYRLIRKNIKGVICPRKEIADSFKVNSLVVPDYIYCNGSNNTLKTYSEKKYDFCIIGRITKEKGVIETLNYLSKMKCSVVVAGRPETDDLKIELLRHKKENIDMVLDYISSEEYHSYLDNSKYIILNYSSEYSQRSSGVVFDALFRGVPVVGKKCKSLDFIMEYEMGIVYNDINDLDIKVLLDKFLYNSFLKHIAKYKELHNEYKQGLIDFLN